MTVSTTSIRNFYTGNAVATEFAYSFPILTKSDLWVELTKDGGTTVAELDADYSVSGAGNEGGGIVTFMTAPDTDKNGIMIERRLPLVQPTDYKNQSTFYASTHEKSFDRATMQVQQYRDEVSRAIRFKPSPDGATPDLQENAAGRANKYLSFDGEGNPTVSDTTGILVDASTSGALTPVPSKDAVPSLVTDPPGFAAALDAQAQALANRIEYYAGAELGAPPPGFVPKIPPSKQRLINELRTKTGLTRTLIGNGRRSAVGNRANQLVFRTLHNAMGGTDGSAAIQLRIGTAVASATNADFRVEIDPAYVGGVTVSVIRSATASFPSSGLVRTPMTNAGSGVYTLNVASTQPSTLNYGIEVRLVPSDPTNNATLHDQFFVVNRVEIKHGGVTVLDTDTAVSGTPFLQLVSASKVNAFKQEIINNGTIDVSLLHNGCVSGKVFRYVYSASNVTSGGTGDELDPVSINAGLAAFNAGDTDTLLLSTGRHVLAGQRPRAIATVAGVRNGCIACLDGVAQIDSGLAVPFGSLSNNGNGTYSYVYDPTNHYNRNNIIAGNNDAYILLTEHFDKNLYKTATLGEVATRDWSYYFDRSTLTFTIRFDGVQTGGITVCEAGIGLEAGGFELLQCANVDFWGQQAAAVNISSGVLYELYSVRAMLGSAVGEVFDIDNCDGVQVDCDGIRSRNDIYNFHGYGHQEMYNCRGNWAQDDAISHHDNCTGYVQGGTFTNSGKGNFIPAFGAFATAFRITSSGANLGTSSNAEPGNFGGMVALSSNSDTATTVMVAIQNKSTNDQYGVLSSGPNSVAVEYGNVIVTPTVKPLGARGWTSNGNGHLVAYDRAKTEVEAPDPKTLTLLRSRTVWS